MTIKEKLIAWVLDNIQNKGFNRFDDIHLDQLSDEYSSSHTWIMGIEKVISILQEIKGQVPTEFSVTVGISLRSTDCLSGMTFTNRVQLEKEFTVTPPSLYVFKNENEPWNCHPELTSELKFEFVSIPRIKTNAFLLEWKEEFEEHYNRSLWLALA